MSVPGPDGKPAPGTAPAAKQEGRHVAAAIKARLSGDTATRPFHYRHQGSLAQIGKRRAVIDFGWIKLRGARSLVATVDPQRARCRLSGDLIGVRTQASASRIPELDHRGSA